MSHASSLPHPACPIGIFDSGVGGLTVAHTLATQLPNEQIIYIGDTAHTPWGDKSSASIANYANQLVRFLIEKNCKLILIACHSASAVAYPAIRASLAQISPHTLLVNMIDPVIHFLSKKFDAHSTHPAIGLIGTKQTIHSKAYQNKLSLVCPQFDLRVLATPLLCPLIEENLPLTHPLANLILQEYLSRSCFHAIDALILGCTHYPLLLPLIQKAFEPTIDIIDPSFPVVDHLSQLLQDHHLANPHATQNLHHEFYVTDNTSFFSDVACRFFSQTILLKTHCF